jgi:hypothetical protein
VERVWSQGDEDGPGRVLRQRFSDQEHAILHMRWTLIDVVEDRHDPSTAGLGQKVKAST